MESTEFVTRLTGALADEDLAKGTIQRTVTDARQFEAWYDQTTGHGIDPDDIQIVAIDLQEFRGWLQREDMTPGTIQRKFASIRKALMLIAPDLALRLRWPKLPTEQKVAPSGFTRAERNAIIRAAEQLSPRDRCIVQLLLNTGARASSLADLRLDDVVIKARSGEVTYRHAKNDRTYAVPLNVEARTAVEGYLEVRPPVTQHDRLLCSERFPYPPVSRQVVWSVWHERMRRHLPKQLADRIRGPHQARHDLARRLLSGDEGRRAPVPAADAAAILGHVDPRITVGIYSRPSEEDTRRALDGIVGEEDGDGDEDEDDG